MLQDVSMNLERHLPSNITNNFITGLPDYSDTGYSDIPATVTVFWSKKGFPYTENPCYSDSLLTVTLFGRSNPAVTVSGEACTISNILSSRPVLLANSRLL